MESFLHCVEFNCQLLYVSVTNIHFTNKDFVKTIIGFCDAQIHKINCSVPVSAVCGQFSK